MPPSISPCTVHTEKGLSWVNQEGITVVWYLKRSLDTPPTRLTSRRRTIHDQTALQLSSASIFQPASSSDVIKSTIKIPNCRPSAWPDCRCPILQPSQRHSRNSAPITRRYKGTPWMQEWGRKPEPDTNGQKPRQELLSQPHARLDV